MASDTDPVPQLFDRSMKRRQRAAAAQRQRRLWETSESGRADEDPSFLRKEVARRLADRIEDVSFAQRQQLAAVLDLGCAEGHVSAALLEADERVRRSGGGNSGDDDDDDDGDGPGGELRLPSLATLFLQESSRDFLQLAAAGCRSSDTGVVRVGEIVEPPRATPQSPGTLLPEAGHADPGRAVSVQPVLADEEALPFAADSLDLVVSNLSLHWCNDLPGVFAQVHRALRPDGMFIGAFFGEDTLSELRTAFALAEQERDAGVAPHVSPFVGVSDLGNLMSRAKFAIPTIDHDTIQIHFSDAFALMRDVQAMGENNGIRQRRLHTPRDTFVAASAIYSSLYGISDDDYRVREGMIPSGAIPATFEIVYLIGWKPSADQQQPDERGSATRSFRELGVSDDLH
jgi:SAM-dependent methyltransferase